MKSLEFLEKHRGEKGLSWRRLAKITKVSEAYWWKVMDGGQLPTLDRAQQLAEGTEMPKEVFVDLVFRDRLLQYLEKEGLFENPPTENIKKIIELLKKWDPEKGDLTRYIMSSNISLTPKELCNMYIGLRSTMPVVAGGGNLKANGEEKAQDNLGCSMGPGCRTRKSQAARRKGLSRGKKRTVGAKPELRIFFSDSGELPN